jgi:hypothetical protein
MLVLSKYVYTIVPDPIETPLGFCCRHWWAGSKVRRQATPKSSWKRGAQWEDCTTWRQDLGEKHGTELGTRHQTQVHEYLIFIKELKQHTARWCSTQPHATRTDLLKMDLRINAKMETPELRKKAQESTCTSGGWQSLLRQNKRCNGY